MDDQDVVEPRGGERRDLSGTRYNNGSDKRRKLDPIERQSQFTIRYMKSSHRLTYTDYTIGWICALHLEMTAAAAMLDEEHEALPGRAGDDNIYMLGSMSGHNVVIACLPNGVYGTTSATVVGLAMRLTFPNILPLMVGVGGGVPSQAHDIRLGDVIVGVPTSEGPAVKQYDYGKTTSNGLPEVKGQLNKPAPILLSAVAKLKTAHELRPPGQYITFISEALEQYGLPTYAYPGAEYDNLLESECEHSGSDICGSSCSLKYVLRNPRADRNPIIHFGSIGSGNQVIKHGQMRDRIAKPLNIICFEMEAAGLMDYLPCLVIRGVCDYCDTQKRKEFQGYAALAAAAYAKELLSMVPTRETPSQPVASEQIESADLEHRKVIMEALDFEEAESRRATVKKAHMQTCKWFTEQQQFVDWLGENNSLLWVKGKPGTGKSTLMKYILEREERSKSTDRVTISFFFNARGHSLERSVIGMYRSLLFQLFKQMAPLQYLLDGFRSDIVFEENKLGVLEDLFRRVIGKLGSKQLLCFIDALDECPESEIRDMVCFFEELGEVTAASKINFHVLLSSRHYPNISIERGTTIILEDQDGHSHDIAKYINANLKIGKTKVAEQIKRDVVEKSHGIFLWVVLTLRILKTEYDKGQLHSLKNRLKDIPLELNDLFQDILTRDNQRLPQLVLCIQWILYAKRPLFKKEFYLALLTADNSVDLGAWDEETPSLLIDNFILDCSKGLAELTRAKNPTVQFIHESVREYLLLPQSLKNLWPGFHGILEGVSHQQLRDCCMRYMKLSDLVEFDLPVGVESSKSAIDSSLREKVKSAYPFLSYATQYILHHAEAAEQSQLSQVDFLSSFQIEQWRQIHNVLQQHGSRRLLRSFPCVLAALELQRLLFVWLSLRNPSETDLEELIDFSAGRQDLDTIKKILEWYHADRPNDVSHEYVDIFFELLLDAKSTNRHCRHDVTRIMLHWPSVDRQVESFGEVFELAVEMKRPDALRLLCSRTKIDTSIVLPQIPLWYIYTLPSKRRMGQYTSSGLSAEVGGKHNDVATQPSPTFSSDMVECMEILVDHIPNFNIHDSEPEVVAVIAERAGEPAIRYMIDRGLSINIEDGQGMTSLHHATNRGDRTGVQALLQCGANANARLQNGETPLHIAENQAIVRILLEHGADVNAKDNGGKTVLHGCKYLDITEALLEYGANVNDRDNEGRTALHYYQPLNIIMTLLQYGVDVNAKDKNGKIALHYDKPLDITEALLQHGADVNARDNDGRTALHLVRCPESVKRLLRYGADVNVRDNEGKPPIYYADELSVEEILREYPLSRRGMVKIPPYNLLLGGNSYYMSVSQ